MLRFDFYNAYFNSVLTFNFPSEKQNFHSFYRYFEAFINSGEVPNNAGQLLAQSSRRSFRDILRTVMGKKRIISTMLSFYSMNIYGEIYYDKNVTLVDKFFYENYGARI